MSNAQDKKARGDAVLKTMGDALQEEFYQQLRHTTQAKALKWLEETHGLKVSAGVATNFWQWYPRSCVLRRAARTSDQLEASLNKMPELREKADLARKVAQVNFELMAAENRDPAMFSMLGKASLEKEKLQLEREKFEHSKKEDWEHGIDALLEEAKEIPEARRLIEQAGALIKKART